MHEHHTDFGTGPFPRDTAGLPRAEPTPRLALEPGDVLDLRIGPVVNRIDGNDVRMLAYNGSIPGPTLRVRQGSHVVVNVTNDGDIDATVHWHGLRLENRFDGVPHETQQPIPVGGRFTYEVRFPDAGLYWYHPHIREDYSQEMGLYGTIVVEPSDPDYWPPVDRDVVLAIDDILLEDGRIATFDRAGPDHTAMGRFGNVLLVNGRSGWALDARPGEVVRFLLVNTANTRVFDVAIPGTRMKLVGGDSGRYERETFVDHVMIAPSERAVADVRFEEAGELTLEHRTPDRTAALGTITVAGEPMRGAAATFERLRSAPELVVERERIEVELAREPDEELGLVAEMDVETPAGEAPAAYACPMDPEVVSPEPARCPKCGMKLLPIAMVPAALERREQASGADASDAPDHVTEGHGGHGGPAAEGHGGHEAGGHEAGGIEWEDTMEEVNRLTTPATMRWLLVDRKTGRRNAAIEWAFTVGDRVKIRLVNEMDSDHPMHHPFHIHGAGRFLVLSRGGEVEPNLVWKDTVLVRTGETVDVLLDVSNPGLWMAHCHIAEHAESGMMFSFRVARSSEGEARSAGGEA
ncbi:MAG: multicopper oxidase domain-containing protein, partial [Candidatus Velamenicoccus archaeovorus]